MMNSVSYLNFGMLGPLEIIVILAAFGGVVLFSGLVVVVVAFIVNRRSKCDQSDQPPVIKS